jgi:deoxyhypusine monooxygenase
MFATPPISELVSTLEDPCSPIGKRMRAAYYCKQVLSDDSNKNNSNSDNKDGVDLLAMLGKQLLNPEHGSLLRHEFAYILGQLQKSEGIAVLESVVANTEECVMVRHEAAEALGAIANPSSIPLLERHIDESVPKELADTCVLSVKRIRQEQENAITGEKKEVVACPCSSAPFSATVDPALASSNGKDGDHDESVETLQSVLENPQTDLVERYRTMFALRNRGAVEPLCKVLREDTSSSLLRHELAFCLGQLQSPKSIACLMGILARPEEHVMVRHEAAEALGAIEGCTSEEWKTIEDTLRSYQKDPIRAIAESCVVALDAADYWGHTAAVASESETNENDDDVLLFRQHKNQAAGIDSSNVRKEILNQHFNVAATT